MDWMKIGAALLLVMFIVMLWPRAKEMLTNSPKAEKVSGKRQYYLYLEWSLLSSF